MQFGSYRHNKIKIFSSNLDIFRTCKREVTPNIYTFKRENCLDENWENRAKEIMQGKLRFLNKNHHCCLTTFLNICLQLKELLRKYFKYISRILIATTKKKLKEMERVIFCSKNNIINREFKVNKK